MTLHQKKIIIGVSGSIAAYKAVFLVRLLIKSGAEVKVIMTPSAQDFVTPLTFSTLSKHPVHSDVSSESGWNNHVEMGLWADAFIIAPATANTIARMANGICDNMLLATYLSSRCPVFLAPAMDLDMWVHPATLNNIDKLKHYGNHIIPVEDGELASGLVGKGRMAEPEHIVAYLDQFFKQQNNLDLDGQTVLMTSGPTLEPIDPVRYISNHSTGKMGTAIATELAQRGAKVHFVTGPAKVKPQQHTNIEIINVQSAEEMCQAALERFELADITVLTAAVADYTPADPKTKKIKKKTDDFHLELKKTPDIAATLGKQKQNHQKLIGFALETNNALENAVSKLERKNLDMIVLNSMENAGAGFGHDTNKVTFIQKNGNIEHFPQKSKAEVAVDIVNTIVNSIITKK